MTTDVGSTTFYQMVNRLSVIHLEKFHAALITVGVEEQKSIANAAIVLTTHKVNANLSSFQNIRQCLPLVWVRGDAKNVPLGRESGNYHFAMTKYFSLICQSVRIDLVTNTTTRRHS